MCAFLYRKYSDYLLCKYGQKVYKLPVNLNLNCPNRDGNIGTGGCIFCGEEGAGFESLSSSFSIAEQLKRNRDYIQKKYRANKFIAYFQNYTNTYMPIDKFKDILEQAACIDDIVEISIATRPDCINTEYLKVADCIKSKFGICISFEIGLQTANYKTLSKINRGHGIAEFIDAAINVHNFGFEICAHVILDLPWDTMEDVIETSKFISSLKIEQVKMHSLFVVKNTVIANMYQNGDIELIKCEDYKDRVITFLEYLSPEIVIQRLIGRAPKSNVIVANWNTSWWKIRDDIESKMILENRYQGKNFDYLNGKAISR